MTFERYRREIDELKLRPESRKLFLRDNAIRIFKLDQRG